METGSLLWHFAFTSFYYLPSTMDPRY